MSEEPIPLEKLLQGAERLAAEGNRDAARLAVREALRTDMHSLRGWTMLAQLAENDIEEVACLKYVLLLDREQAWASQRLRQLALLQSTPLTGSLAGIAEAGPSTNGLSARLASEPVGATPLAEAARAGQPPQIEASAGAEPTPEAAALVPGFGFPTEPGPLLVSPASTSLSLEPEATTHQWRASLPPPPGPVDQSAPAYPQRRRKETNPALVFFGAVLVLLTCVCGLTGYAVVARAFLQTVPNGPADPANCQALIRAALLASQISCTRLGPNQVCYGNTTLSAQLVQGAAGRFQGRGDIIDVSKLSSLKASPLDPDNDQWGIALFKLLGNLPGAPAAQNVTFWLFGNTTLTNTSGDLLTFDFSSQAGRVACSRIPFDGIVVQMPQGAGITFQANGADITLAGTAALEAHSDKWMAVSLAQGSASVSSNGETQFFGAGEGVQVPLSGPSGLVASGPPTTPTAATSTLTLVCSMLGLDCNGQVPTIAPDHAATAIAAAVATSTIGPTQTAMPTASSTASPTPSSTTTPSRTPSATASATATRTPTATPTPTTTPTATATGTPPPPTQTFTPVPSWTPSPVYPTNTALPPSLTATPSVPPTPSRTAGPTSTPTVPATRTATRTATLPPLPTSTRTATATLAPTVAPTVTQTPVCQLSAGALTTNFRNLNLPLQNNGGSTVTITSIVLTWPQSPNQQLTSVRLGGTQIDGSTYNSSPSNIPVGGNWAVGPTSRQLASGSGANLQFRFALRLQQPTGYAVTVNFDNGCAVNATK